MDFQTGNVTPVKVEGRMPNTSNNSHEVIDGRVWGNGTWNYCDPMRSFRRIKLYLIIKILFYFHFYLDFLVMLWYFRLNFGFFFVLMLFSFRCLWNLFNKRFLRSCRHSNICPRPEERKSSTIWWQERSNNSVFSLIVLFDLRKVSNVFPNILDILILWKFFRI